MANIRLIGDKVALKVDAEKENVTKSGLLLSTQPVKEFIGTVVAVGTGKDTYSSGWQLPSVSVGERVVYDKHAGTELKVDDEKYLIIREGEIVCVLPVAPVNFNEDASENEVVFSLSKC